jgi:hypothetical protein
MNLNSIDKSSDLWHGGAVCNTSGANAPASPCLNLDAERGFLICQDFHLSECLCMVTCRGGFPLVTTDNTRAFFIARSLKKTNGGSTMNAKLRRNGAKRSDRL